MNVSKTKAWEWFQLALIGAMFATAAIRWGSVPDRIPIHWNAAGEVDGYGGRFAGLLLEPLMTLGMYLLIKYIPRIDPARKNYASFAGTYLLIRVVFVVYLAFVYGVTNLAIGREKAVAADRLIIGAVGVLFMVLGGAMGKIRPNWFAGIRTPWTLTSKLSWVKTHRMGGRVFIAAGAISLIGAFFEGSTAVYAMLVVLLGGTAFLIVYSYRVWRDDPDRVAAQDTSPAGGDESAPAG
jgi:uncharacterized membrane protein